MSLMVVIATIESPNAERSLPPGGSPSPNTRNVMFLIDEGLGN